jgi:hypothetical protein
MSYIVTQRAFSGNRLLKEGDVLQDWQGPLPAWLKKLPGRPKAQKAEKPKEEPVTPYTLAAKAPNMAAESIKQK